METIPVLRFPEAVALCAEWGDPCLHPAVIEAINRRIEREWLATRYVLMTNLSRKDAILMALPYTRGLLINFTMSEPSHAQNVMGYRQEKIFEDVLSNIKLVARLKTEKRCNARVGVIFVVNPLTAPYISAHYQLLKEIEGLDFRRYKPAWGLEALSDNRDVIEQRKILQQMNGKVPYDWKI